MPTPLQHEGAAPYTTPTAVTTVIERSRGGTLPQPIDSNVLTRIGVQESLAPRTLAGLKLLGLVDEAGEPTETLEKFRLAGSDEFKSTVADWLREIYSEVFQIVGDPGQADYKRVEDAFRHYTPHGQRTRMVTLFIGLCDYAELLPENSPLRSATRAVRKDERPQPRPKRNAPKPAMKREQQHRQEGAGSQPGFGAGESRDSNLDPIIDGLVKRLPPAESEWPMAKRKAWLQAAEAAFAVLYELPAEDREEVMQ